ncbi:MAG: hypothetical protein GX089_01310 [Fibrobacter sp.]|jgi:uncharacterized protein YqgV (UPF0045/DUF77 family)|nr:hypothetical protein [Fibrobacter sp.]NLP01111.1 hypothetical protein [Fibrobacter sp.]
MNIQAEVSYYPLGRTDFNNCINKFCRIISNKELIAETNTMSTVIIGDTSNVMHSLAEAIEAVAHQSKFVVVCKISNACPLEHEGGRRKL